MNIIEASDPASSLYAPGSPAYAGFAEALPQLAALNAPTNSAAGELAYAIGFPRADSTLAAHALISLGPQWVATDLPILLDHLTSPRADVRLFALIAMSITGRDGSCALDKVGPLLWDSDPGVRSAAALAAQSLSGQRLVDDAYAIDPASLSPAPVEADTPPGRVSGGARAWWSSAGSKVNWHPRYGLCDP